MRIFLAVSSFLIIALLTAGIAQPRGWRGIVPLYSTRADVEQTLGEPNQKMSEYSVFYRTPKETVIVQYARGRPCGIGENYSQWRVPRDTVESILVTPTEPVRLSELGIDERKYKQRSGGHRPEDIYYINEQDGESLRVFQDEVMEISYFPGEVDKDLRCPALTAESDTKCEGLTPPPFDSYGNLAVNHERLRLDNFSIALKDEENRTGYIIAYAGKLARAGEAKARAERAKNYLVNVRGFPANRLEALDGGYRAEPEVQLYVVPYGGCPPIASPTVDPRDVQFIKTRRTKNRRSSSMAKSRTT